MFIANYSLFLNLQLLMKTGISLIKALKASRLFVMVLLKTLNSKCQTLLLLSFFNYLLTHQQNQVRISGSILFFPIRIGVWNTNDYFRIFIDGQNIDQAQGQSSCGIGNYEKYSIEQTIKHNFNTALVIIYTSTTGFWEISNFKLYIQKCPDQCLYCDYGQERTSQCITWLLGYNSLSQANLNDFTISDWIVSNNKQLASQYIPLLCAQGGILNYCYTDTVVQMQTKLPAHTKLKFHFRFFKFDSWVNADTTSLFIDTIKIWEGNYVGEQFTNFCGQSYDDFNDNIEIEINHSNQNLQVLFQGQLMDPIAWTNKSYAIRDIQIFVNNICDEYYNYECCGDSIKQRGEDCDDGNNYPFDGCHNCIFSCTENCSLCVKGECYEYEVKENLQEINSFEIIQYQSFCDPGCSICIQQLCLQCQEGWILEPNLYICLQKLEIITYSECDVKCSFCFQGICQQCNYGYSLTNNQCQSICGDNLVNKDVIDGNPIEECDTNTDGCMNCQIEQDYSCISEDQSICWQNDQNCVSFQTSSSLQYCIQCQDGYYIQGFQCLQCNSPCITCNSTQCTTCYTDNCEFCEQTDGLYTDEILKKCYSICGDGILVSTYEQCDNGNLDNHDGCSSNCEIEANWVCNQECYYSKNPEILLNYISQSYESQFVEISFTQQVQRNSNNLDQYKDTINITLLAENVTYNITIFSVQSATYKLQWVNYQIEIDIYETLDYQPYLLIVLGEQLYNSDNLPLTQTNVTIKLQQPQYISQSQVERSQNLVSMSKASMYSLSAVCGLLLFTGSSSFFWSALEILQEQSYLQYINVNYPGNFLIYFQSFEIVSLTPLLEYLHLDAFFFPSKFNFQIISAEDKFLFYEINASIAYNFKSVGVSILCMILTYYLMLCFCKILTHLLNDVTNMNFFIAKFLQSAYFRMIKITQLIKRYGFHQLMMANFWDISFMVFLQLRYHSNDLEGLLLNLGAFIFLIIGILFIVLNIRGKQNGRNGLDKYRENLLEISLITKKLAFTAVLVYFQKHQILQVNLLSIINTTYLICGIFLRNPQNQLENIKNIILESSLVFVIISSQLYVKCMNYSLSSEQQVNLAWVHIGILCFVTLSHMACDTYEAGKKFIKNVKEIISPIHQNQPKQKTERRMQPQPIQKIGQTPQPAQKIERRIQPQPKIEKRKPSQPYQKIEKRIQSQPKIVKKTQSQPYQNIAIQKIERRMI